MIQEGTRRTVFRYVCYILRLVVPGWVFQGQVLSIVVVL